MPKPKRLGLWCLSLLLTALWIGAIAGGFARLREHESSPGQAGEPPSSWPAGATIKSAPDQPTLVVFAHPQCPCTRATIGELALLMARCQDRVQAHVLFYKPADSTPAWEQTTAWSAAAQIPGVAVTVDLDGVEATRFCAKTSGHVLLYGRDGKLLFTGGITASRGHAGENRGRSAIVSLVTCGVLEVDHTPVFGCPILKDKAQAH
jgi:hypothetical protein